jgi:hypothetical protein
MAVDTRRHLLAQLRYIQVLALALVKHVAASDAQLCPAISQYLLKHLSNLVELPKPGPCSSICWSILAIQAKTSPEATAFLHEYTHHFLGVLSSAAPQSCGMPRLQEVKSVLWEQTCAVLHTKLWCKAA